MQKIKRLYILLMIIIYLTQIPGISQDWSSCGSNSPDELIFIVNSIEPLKNGPTEKTIFTLTSPRQITLIRTCHWNYGRGQILPKTNLVIERVSDGVVAITHPITYGETSGGVGNVYWVVCGGKSLDTSQISCKKPEALGERLEAGTYEVIDPDENTWSYNSDTRGRGITFIYAAKI
jgi:hypothetical protein